MIGPVEAKVRADVDALVVMHPMGEALAEMAFALAATIDQGESDNPAALNRELRLTLTELANTAVSDDDGFEAGLSTPLRDPEVP